MKGSQMKCNKQTSGVGKYLKFRNRHRINADEEIKMARRNNKEQVGPSTNKPILPCDHKFEFDGGPCVYCHKTVVELME